MDAKTRALHQQLIRLAKGAIKAWEAYVAPAAAQYPKEVTDETATIEAPHSPGSPPDAPVPSRPLGHPVSLVSRTEAQNGR